MNMLHGTFQYVKCVKKWKVIKKRKALEICQNKHNNYVLLKDIWPPWATRTPSIYFDVK